MTYKVLSSDSQRLKRVALSILSALFLTIACESNMESDYNPPNDHSLSKDGIMHKSGLNDPVDNCASCHGEDLRGGSAVVSCYECHGKKW